jgi:hypothetical protein
MPGSLMTLLLHQPGKAVALDADRLQGSWTEAQSLRLSATTSRLLELVAGLTVDVTALFAAARRQASEVEP